MMRVFFQWILTFLFAGLVYITFFIVMQPVDFTFHFLNGIGIKNLGMLRDILSVIIAGYAGYLYLITAMRTAPSRTVVFKIALFSLMVAFYASILLIRHYSGLVLANGISTFTGMLIALRKADRQAAPIADIG